MAGFQRPVSNYSIFSFGNNSDIQVNFWQSLSMIKPWKKIITIIKNIVFQFRQSEISMVAGSLSFSSIMCLVPFIAVTVAIIQSIGGLEAFAPKVENLLLTFLKEAAGYDATKVIKISVRNVQNAKIGIIGAGFLFVTSLRLMQELENAINRVWNIRIRRNFFKRLIVYWTIVIMLPLLLSLYVGFSSLEAVKLVNRLIPEFASDGLFLLVVLFTCYRWVPHTEVQPKIAATCAFITSIALYIVHTGFVTIAKGFFSYNKIYGSFAALPILLVWLLSIWHVFLAGAALCAGLQRGFRSLERESEMFIANQHKEV